MRAILLRLAARNLWRNARRSLITVSAVATGTAGLIFLWGYVDGMNQQMIDNTTRYLAGHLQVHRLGFQDDPTPELAFANAPEMINRIAAEPAVTGVAPRVEGTALASGPEKSRGVVVMGIDPARETTVTTLAAAVKQGTFLKSGDASGIVVGDKVADVLRVSAGGEVVLITQAADGSIGAGRYRVRGIYDSGIDLIDGNFVLLPLSAAQELFALPGRVNALAIRLKDLDALPRVQRALHSAIGPDFEVLGWPRLLPAVVSDIRFHEVLTYIVLTVVFMIVTLGIANTVLMAVMERIREFGIMMALGTEPGQIGRSVIYESMLLGCGGLILGGAVGAGIVYYYGWHGLDFGDYAKAMATMPGLTSIVYPLLRADHVLLVSTLILGTVVLAAIYPAWKAAGYTPVEAIRGAAASVRTHAWPWVQRWRLSLPARALFVRIAYRGLMRNPRRTMLTLGALTAGLAAYLFLSALGQGFYVQMRDNATDMIVGHAQVEVRGFRDEYDPKQLLINPRLLLDGVRHIAGVAAATPRLQAQAVVSSPRQTEPVMLYGVEPQDEQRVTRLHRFVSEGEFLQEGSRREIIVGDKLAARLKVRLGDKIVVTAPAADGSLGQAALRIHGIFRTDNDLLDRNVVLTGIGAARELLAVPHGATSIVVRLNGVAAPAFADVASRSLPLAPDEQVVSWEQMLPEVVQMLSVVRVNLYVVLAVVFVIVALSVLNTLLMAVFERRREFGVQLALGTEPPQIVRTILYESLVLGVLGLVAGFVSGSLIVGYYHTSGFDLSAYASGIKSMPGMTGIVYPTLVAGEVWLPAVALFVTSVAAALYPAWRAVRLDPVTALRRT